MAERIAKWQLFFRGYDSINEDELEADKVLQGEEESEEIIVKCNLFHTPPSTCQAEVETGF